MMFGSKYQQLLRTLKCTPQPVSFVEATVGESQDNVSKPVSTFEFGVHNSETDILNWLPSSRSEEMGGQQAAHVRLLSYIDYDQTIHHQPVADAVAKHGAVLNPFQDPLAVPFSKAALSKIMGSFTLPIEWLEMATYTHGAFTITPEAKSGGGRSSIGKSVNKSLNSLTV